MSTCDTFVPVREHIDALRWIKSSAEQDLMRQTCSIGAHSMNAVIAKSRGVSNENEIIGQLELEVRRRGAASLAYPPVVAAGNRANIIHYLDANKVPFFSFSFSDCNEFQFLLLEVFKFEISISGH